jgi:hypothetical protein
MTGRIGIYGFDHELLDERPYCSKEGWLTIVEFWEKEYFGLAAYFQLSPVPIEIKATKSERKYTRTPKVEPDVKIKFERPAAQYTNLPSPLNVYSQQKINGHETNDK